MRRQRKKNKQGVKAIQTKCLKNRSNKSKENGNKPKKKLRL